MFFHRIRALLSVAVLVAIEVAILLALLQVGTREGMSIAWDHPGAWLAQTPTDDVLVTLVRVGALALVCWLLISTLLYVGASALRLPRLVRSIEWATLPSVRRLVDGAVAGTLMAGVAFGVASPALASDTTATSHAYVPHPAGDGPVPAPAAPTTMAPTTTSTTLPVTPGPARLATVPTVPAQPASQAPAATYVVRAGDCMWHIAVQFVAARGGGEDDVAPYWRRLVGANRDRLASGDPNLIYPGEELVLPELQRG